MRIDLGLQCFELGLPGKDFGTAGSLQFERGVVQRDGHLIHQQHDDGKHGHRGQESLFHAGEGRHEHGGGEAADQHHGGSKNQRGGEVVHHQTERMRGAQGQGTADIERREADEGEHHDGRASG